jgi:hypothetical protein
LIVIGPAIKNNQVYLLYKKQGCKGNGYNRGMFRVSTGLFFVLLLTIFAGCAIPPSTQTTSPTHQPQPISVVTPTSDLIHPTLTPVRNPTKIHLWVDPHLPTAFREGIRSDADVISVNDQAQADLQLGPSVPGRQGHSVSWVYALAARFPTLEENYPSGTIKQIWRGDSRDHILIVDEDTLNVFSELWGLPQQSAVKVLAPQDMLTAAWKDPRILAIIPFQSINPRWKVLRVDGLSPLDRAMNESVYPLAVNIELTSVSPDPVDLIRVSLPPTNRDPQQLLTLIMTGTTALARKTAQTMNEKGVLYPAQDVGEILRTADLTHISNEVSFNPDCSPAKSASPEGIFCSAPDYIQLLENVGTDIVELTGNHNLDRGAEAYLYSLDQFHKRNWITYGGGRDLDEARRAVLVDRGNTKLVFLGCNMAGPELAWATRDSPGAATCDIPWMENQVRQFRSQGYLPIVTFQAFETEDYMPSPMQRPSDFQGMARAGAVIVSGSQAHFPQGFFFVGENFIHYGLGNLFFDQISPPATRKSFIDRHVFYAGRYLGVELITVRLEDYARPRLMTDVERQTFLKRVFQASGW